MNRFPFSKALINDTKSCVSKINHNLSVALPPLYIGLEKNGVSIFLQGWINHYVKSLGGIVIDYENVKLHEPDGKILSDLPYFYHQVSADFYVFKPIVGEILFGKVNKVSQSHAGCLVYGCVNVSLTLDHEIEEATIDSFICIGQDMAFEISSINAGENNMRIRGRITKKCLDLLKEQSAEITKPKRIKIINGYTVSDSESDDSAQEEILDDGGQPSRKRKRDDSVASIGTTGFVSPILPKKRKKFNNKLINVPNSPSQLAAALSDSGVESLAANFEEVALVPNGDFRSPSKKDKVKSSSSSKKSKKSPNSFSDSSESLEIETTMPCVSNTKMKKKHPKNIEKDVPQFSVFPESPKKKKKKHSKKSETDNASNCAKGSHSLYVKSPKKKKKHRKE